MLYIEKSFSNCRRKAVGRDDGELDQFALFLPYFIFFFSSYALFPNCFFNFSGSICVSVYVSVAASLLLYISLSLYLSVCVSLMCCQNVFVLFAVANFIFCFLIFSSLSVTLCLCPWLCAWHGNKLKPNRIKKEECNKVK